LNFDGSLMYFSAIPSKLCDACYTFFFWGGFLVEAVYVYESRKRRVQNDTDGGEMHLGTLFSLCSTMMHWKAKEHPSCFPCCLQEQKGVLAAEAERACSKIASHLSPENNILPARIWDESLRASGRTNYRQERQMKAIL